jgi:hypothetical protein
MTSGIEQEEERDRKGTVSLEGGRKEQRRTPLTRVAKIVEIVGTSGWLIVAALIAFVIMIHRSMKQEAVINEQ